MGQTNENQNPHDSDVEQVWNVLMAYTNGHPHAQIEVRRQNSVSIRIRIIDPDFEGLDRVDREPEVWTTLKALPKDVFVQVTMLLLLTPEDAKHSLANLEFDDPIPSRL